MTGTTISSFRSVRLSLLVSSENPVTITSAGTISTGTADAVYGTVGVEWSISNDGLIASTGKDGIDLAGTGIVVNDGSISGTVAVAIAGGGTVTNAGSIYGTKEAIYLSQTGTVLNTGSIASSTLGVVLAQGGVVTNAATSEISAGFDGTGIYLRAGGGTVMNYGAISAPIGVWIAGEVAATVVNAGSISSSLQGVDLASEGGWLSNTSTAEISGNIDGVYAPAPGTVVNAGFITGSAADGIYFRQNGLVSNAVTGTIFGGRDGIYLLSAGTVVNAGTISAGTTTSLAVDFVSGNALLVDEAGAVFNGIVQANAAYANMLELASSGSTGTISGIGTSFTNFGTVSEDAGASWSLSGGGTAAALDIANSAGLTLDETDLTFTAGLLDDGQLILDPSTLTVASLTGTGTATLQADSSLDVQGSVAAGETIVFAGSGAQLELDSIALVDGTITGFAAGDTIALDNFEVSSLTYVSGTGLVLAAGAVTETLALLGDYTTAQFTLSESGGTTDIALCLCAGTRIATPQGEVAVETLRPGDRVTTARGTAAVRWVGRRAYDGRFIAGNHLALPICIRARALGPNMPASDLYVSPGHGIWLGGVLVPAWLLVNGASITQAESVETVEYFNIELEEHELLFAAGAAVESFLDDGIYRQQFQNHTEYWALYPDAPLCRDLTPLPRLESGFRLETLRGQLNRRAGIAPVAAAPGDMRGYIDIIGEDGWVYGWAQDMVSPETPVALRIYAHGRYIARTLANVYRPDLRQAGMGSGCHGFAARVPLACAGMVEVRREADGAVLPRTHAAREAAA